jgi:hypothetical protein
MAHVNQNRSDLGPGFPQVRPRSGSQPEFGQRGAVWKSMRWPPQEFAARQVRFRGIGVERKRLLDGGERTPFTFPVVRRETERLNKTWRRAGARRQVRALGFAMVL